MRKFLTVFTIFALMLIATPRQSNAATVTVNDGWVSGIISSRRQLLPFEFTVGLGSSAYFSLTDGGVTGDIYTISGSFGGVSTLGLAPSKGIPLGIGASTEFYDAGWLSTAYTHFQVLLGLVPT